MYGDTCERKESQLTPSKNSWFLMAAYLVCKWVWNSKNMRRGKIVISAFHISTFHFGTRQDVNVNVNID